MSVHDSSCLDCAFYSAFDATPRPPHKDTRPLLDITCLSESKTGNFMGVILALLPLVSQIRKLSLAVWGYAIWIAVYCFQLFVNSIIWYKNVDITIPVWCDIVTKLQTGAGIGTRICALVICAKLYKVTRLRGSFEFSKEEKRKVVIYELLLIVAFPVLIMALSVISQPFRFEIIEEEGCTTSVYSYVGYAIHYGPSLISSLACVILAPLTTRTFLRHRKEMKGFFSTSQEMTYNRYNRLMVIAYFDVLFNLPVLMVSLVTSILEGNKSPLNFPFKSWKNVHEGEGGNAPGLSLSSILQVPANTWGMDTWGVFVVKWDEWLYVVHAIMFFCVFGTTPEMRRYYRNLFRFVPNRCGTRRVSDTDTLSDVQFISNPDQRMESIPASLK
ncbi:STE3-domain-containing protein [Schizopora paradoxa]|uniref:STE3-domain-containing protein n=1 Tax=Schizopora paradoxa TaxID=27342 RepID=A0A0H2RCE9_9AGAM|nr:STE3-domain-containing protein [Schizopora paradoxa]